MKRTGWITVAILYQLLYMLVLLGGAVYLLWLTHQARVHGRPGAGDDVFGLVMGAAGAGIPALLGVIGCFGLWQGKRWGWWVMLVVDAVLVFAFVSGMISDASDIDAALIVFSVASVVAVVLLLLPVVRRVYWRKPTVASNPGQI
jgi:uncharacterized membrane protein (DUF2068 family)